MNVPKCTRGSSDPSNRNAVFSDQAVVKNHGNPSLRFSFLGLLREEEDDRNTDLSHKSRTLLAS
ncbi:MAG: hypothetical protein HeimC2_44510 [Candidatus Heimdallarchaeota archaeon LC_2]|nr:MAG: hypothetical protein HeimC2_44510 [Candidatus Heimdallarchaeota archaeon LC_2]